jgi:hypothetical protein
MQFSNNNNNNTNNNNNNNTNNNNNKSNNNDNESNHYKISPSKDRRQVQNNIYIRECEKHIALRESYPLPLYDHHFPVSDSKRIGPSRGTLVIRLSTASGLWIGYQPRF